MCGHSFIIGVLGQFIKSLLQWWAEIDCVRRTPLRMRKLRHTASNTQQSSYFSPSLLLSVLLFLLRAKMIYLCFLK